MKALLTCIFSLSLWAHTTEKVQTLSEALEKHALSSKIEFQDEGLSGQETYLKKMRAANDENHELYHCQVTGDWGPITLLVIVDASERSVLALEILSYVDHVGPGILNSKFLEQFHSLSAENVETAEIIALPQEPKTSLALLEAVRCCLKH